MKDLEMIKEETNKIELLMSEYRKELSTWAHWTQSERF
jgi:hypothetical protein